MSRTISRIALGALLVSFVALGTVAAGSVAAQTNGTDCSDIEDTGNISAYDSCQAGDLQDSGYTSMLDNVFQVAHTTLQYAGFVTVFAGATLWFTARRSSDRAQTGVWLLIGGLAMIVFYFGFTAFVSLLKWIAEGGSS
jgi:heme A synthase